jgi:hypothetical protein
MFTIGRITGTVTWGEIMLDGTTQRSDFASHYPALPLRYPHPTVNGVEWFEYTLPPFAFDGHDVVAEVLFRNDRIVNIFIHQPQEISPEVTEAELENMEFDDAAIRADMEQWATDNIPWLQSVRALLRAQLGEPHMISRAAFGEVQSIGEKRQHEFDNWHYYFQWGRVKFTNEFLDLNQKIVVRLNENGDEFVSPIWVAAAQFFAKEPITACCSKCGEDLTFQYLEEMNNSLWVHCRSRCTEHFLPSP